MSNRSGLPFYLTIAATMLALIVSPRAFAQHGSEGTVAVTVQDPSGSLVQGAVLELRDLQTNAAMKAETGNNGTHTFVNLALGSYRLSVSKPGFKTQNFDSVIVQAAKTTEIGATLTVGAVTETVEVTTSEAPLVETTTNAIGTNIDLKQIENLPIQGRDLSQLSQLVPGYTGTWDGLPAIAQGNNIDGVIGSSSRMKFSGNAAPAVQPRLEDMEEMTVQTEQLNLDQGYGQSNMQVNFVTRRGTNRFHGRVFDDFRNAALNANSWTNDALTALDPSNPQKKNPIKLNDFGGSFGGPIIKNKLFFFGTFAESRQPGTAAALNYVLTPAAQAGNFTYGSNNVNLFTLAQNYNASNPAANLPTTISQGTPSSTQSVLAAVNKSLQYGTVSPYSDPNLNQLNWQVSNPVVYYYPAIRVDYDAMQNMRFNVAWNMTKTSQAGFSVPDFPGPDWSKTGAGYVNKNYTAAFGFEWTLSPTLVNSFHGGFLYNAEINNNNAQALDISNPQLGWNYSGIPQPFNTQMSGTIFYTATGDYYPIFNASDTMTWQHKAHTMNFGFSWWREQDHYYNGALGFPGINFGLPNGDPAVNAFTASSLPGANSDQITEARQLYAILAGRISSVSGSYAFNSTQNNYCQCLGAYNLDEVERAWGLFFQDSYRLKPTFTLNYGLRWDFTGADHDLTKLYHSADVSSIWGPSGVGNLFKPGTLTGTMNPTLTANPSPYNSWNVSPQPAIGFAWNPHKSEGFLGQLLGGDKTVLRGGISLRKFTEPQQYLWNQASDYASFYYQTFALNPIGAGAPGGFTPGALSITDYGTGNWPGYALSPKTYLPSEPISDFTFLGGPGLNGVDPHLKQPYTESWNVGIQRQFGDTKALEIRYIGSRSLHQWIPMATDEINIFENGFVKQFKAAQQNLAINQTHGITSFANNGFAGQQATPIFDAAFAGEAAGGTGVPLSDYAAGNFITNLTTGQAGAMANTLAGGAGTAPYICNLVGSGFAPCANLGFSGAGAGYPINFFQTNPFAQGTGFGYPSIMEAAAYSNYNGLQVDFRERTWHGMQFDANYTWSHTLGIGSQNNWQGQGALFTLRDMRLSYGPSLFDIRHSIHINGTYDLPFGRGRQFANSNGIVDKVIGGWTVGTIFTYQTGSPFLLGGNTLTFNDFADGGVELHGVTPSQLQSAVGVYRIPDSAQVAFINPKYFAVSSGPGTGGGANPAYITANTTPGTIGQRVWLYGPHYWNDDLSLGKRFPIRESMSFLFQAEMLNAFNHPNFGPGPANGCTYSCFAGGFSPYVQSNSFGIGGPLWSGTSPNYNQASPNRGARVIELRANFEF
jgi:carboxypeptidase family protein